MHTYILLQIWKQFFLWQIYDIHNMNPRELKLFLT